MAIMSGTRIAQALARIEAASSRIENAVPDADPALAQKYASLRSEATQALAEIDLLIGRLER